MLVLFWFGISDTYGNFLFNMSVAKSYLNVINIKQMLDFGREYPFLPTIVYNIHNNA